MEEQTYGSAKTNELLKQKEKEYTQAIKLMELQRNLAISIASTNDLLEGLQISLETGLNVSGMDCDGIYLLDEANGDLNLIVHRGLTEELVRAVSHYDKNSENAIYVKKGIGPNACTERYY